ncbi:MAG: glutathione peroxidase [Bacteroidota bacterium]|nr:glutathione peroxidase [Bacteroidota bacterium]
MKQYIKWSFASLLLFGTLNISAQNNFYKLKAETINGETFDFSQLKEKKVLIVNTASKCGYTPQYEQLQALHEQYGDNGFVILGFPANDFLKQEPGSDSEIKNFCQKNYGVTFRMMSKISVKGDGMHPVYKWLTNKELNAFEDSKVSWNFQKYFINERGELVAVFKPKVKPDDDKIIQLINKK